MNPVADSTVTSRLVRPEDAPFLRAVYMSTRAEEVAVLGWSPAQQEAFLTMQFHAQQQDYGRRYPAAEHRILLRGGQAAGQYRVDRTPAEIHLIDVSLLPQARNGGLGGALLRRLREEAAQTQRPLRLSVARDNRARRLYERLGLVVIASTGTHFTMEWRPGPHHAF
jgi:ribosomal protein S18 acetylase RimI-like enzyme